MDDSIDINGIIELVKEQEPARQDLVSALQKCTSGKWDGKAYFRYIDSKNANQPNSEWQFKENIILEDEEMGTIVLDILKTGQIGGIEFIDLIDK